MKIFNEKSKSEIEPKIETRVILEFFRHGKKEKDPNKTNEELLLTKEGREQAVQKGEELDPQAEISVAWGSPRARSRETAALAMLVNEDIDENSSLPEIEKSIDNEINTKKTDNKKKIIEDDRLDFNFTGPGIGKWAAELYGSDKPFLSTYIKESDERALETQDKINDTYTRKAGDIAEIVFRYTKVGDTFNRIASKTDKYEDSNNQLERYLGSHGSVLEPFIAKIIEKTEGVEARDEFTEAIGNDFAETKGIKIEIINHGSEQEINVSYEVNDEEKKVTISHKLLQEILEDEVKFEKQFES